MSKKLSVGRWRRRQPHLRIGVAAGTVLASAFLAISACQPPHPHPHPKASPKAAVTLAQRIAADCAEPSVANAVRLIGEKFPISLPPEIWRRERNFFISQHRWDLFDQNKDGMLDFDEFLSSEWAGYLVQNPTPSCIVTKEYYMNGFLGDPKSPSSGWNNKWDPKTFSFFFEQTDTGHKGYITKEDIAGHARFNFLQMSKTKKNFLLRCDMNSKFCK